MRRSKLFWIKCVQKEIDEEVKQSVPGEYWVKVHGRYRRLSSFQDADGIWRVGSRARDYVPFPHDNKPPIFLPNRNRLTLLLMEDSHHKKHSGVEETLAQFRMMGHWSSQAGKLAKSVKS